MNDSCILVVEDEVEIAELIEFHARRDGFRTRVVHSGKTALDSLSREIPDVVVLDLPATHLNGPPAHLPPLLSDAETEAARAAFAAALQASSEVELSVDGMPLHLAHKWAKMRDCVGVGREHKYSDVQSEYHYTKDRALLTKALAELDPK